MVVVRVRVRLRLRFLSEVGLRGTRLFWNLTFSTHARDGIKRDENTLIAFESVYFTMYLCLVSIATTTLSMLVLVHSLFPLALDGSHLERTADARIESDEPAFHLAFHRELDSAKFCGERTDGEGSGNAAIVVDESARETDVDEDASGGGLSGGVHHG